jgi:hypothetical protein
MSSDGINTVVPTYMSSHDIHVLDLSYACVKKTVSAARTMALNQNKQSLLR